MTRTKRLSLLLGAFTLWFPALCTAQDKPLTNAETQMIVEQLGQVIEANYAFPDKARIIQAALRRHLEAGDYQRITDRHALANALTENLVAATNDLHFSVGLDPAWVAEDLANADPARAAAQRLAERRAEEQVNFGFTGLRRLEGNIAYVSLSHFADPELGYDAAAAAMRFIENSDAVIYDMRYNNGGHLEMAQLLISQLFRSDKDQLLFDYYYTKDGLRVERGQWVLPALPARRLADKPVYVLTSSTSFSAAEWFAFSLQKLGRATIVGEQTAGGAHPVDRKPVGTDFFVQVPIGQIHDPVDRSDFEGKGVTPDHVVTSADALVAAHRLALTALVKADPAKQADADWLAPLLAARAQPVVLAPAAQKAITGRYEGRRIDFANGKAVYTWRERFHAGLEPLGNDLFAVEGVSDFRFRLVRKAGKIVALERMNRDGTTTSYARLD